jgi:hypothetical protein
MVMVCSPVCVFAHYQCREHTSRARTYNYLYLLIFIFIASVGAKQTLNNMQTNCWKQDNSPPRQPVLLRR